MSYGVRYCLFDSRLTRAPKTISNQPHTFFIVSKLLRGCRAAVIVMDKSTGETYNSPGCVIFEIIPEGILCESVKEHDGSDWD